jgi:hypothetical protein
MPIPDYQSLMLPILNVSANGETRIGDAIAGTPVEKPPAPFLLLFLLGGTSVTP